jgi:aldehyde dehydrogenase (NAD+)
MAGAVIHPAPAGAARLLGRVAQYIADGASRPGIEVALDGMASEYRARGRLSMGPTVFSRADNSWRLAREEIFGRLSPP